MMSLHFHQKVVRLVFKQNKLTNLFCKKQTIDLRYLANAS